MTETNTAATNTTPAAAPAEEAADVLLLYVDEESNPGPGEFVMHGVNLYFRRGALTGPVTSSVAGIVTGRKKAPTIRVATEDEVKTIRAAEKAAEKNAAGETSAPPPEKKEEGTDQTGTGTTAPPNTQDPAQAATERKPKSGTRLTTG
jgi:hypothetical protein